MEANNRELLDDLLSDKSFREWVMDPNSGSALYWNNWLEQHPERKQLVGQARDIARTFQFKEDTISSSAKAALLDRIREANRQNDEEMATETIVRSLSGPYIKPAKRISTLSYLLRYAAILGGAIVFALSTHLILSGLEEELQPEIVEKANQRGQKATIFLPDGTAVTLNSSSKLLYPKEFSQESREVYLEGEAFFEVKKDLKPFIVKTPHLTATVLGTSFNMRASPECEESSVALLTGKVVVGLLEEGQQPMVLHPGEKGALDQGLLVKKSFDVEEETAWKDGVLLFREIPFSGALKKMEKWYGVEFIVDELPSQDFLVTGKFRQESLDNVLHSIGYTGKFTHQIKGNKVYLYFNKQSGL